MKIRYSLVFVALNLKLSNVLGNIFRYYCKCGEGCVNEDGRDLLRIAYDEKFIETNAEADEFYKDCRFSNGKCFCYRQFVTLGSSDAGCKCNGGNLISTEAQIFSKSSLK